MSSSSRVLWAQRLVGLFLGLLLLLLVKDCRADEVLGCGGFIRGGVDCSLITVKLLTKSGSLKDKVECAPSICSYFLPVYDKGEYILKLEPPKGWSFEKTEYELNIDGVNDVCSQGKDIDFVFKGFGITGKVVVATESKTEPKLGGIIVSLYDQNKKLIQSTVTSNSSEFLFSPIPPGKYYLTASHPTWLMEKDSTFITVANSNGKVKDGELSVFGFDVTGYIKMTDGEPVGKVSFLLFGNGRTKKCATTPVEGFDSKKKPLCHVTPDETGKFVFPAVSPGEYTLVPYYADSKTKFDVKPSELHFTVDHNSLILAQEFEVTGFTVTGKVMTSTDPAIPLAGAKVFLAKKLIATTDQNGVYKVDNVKTKQYTLYAEASDVKFEEKLVKVSPSNPELPVLTPIAYKVSGKVSSTTKASLQNRKVLINDLASNKQQEAEIDPNTGEWSVYLAPAKYQINVIVSEEEKTKGLQFFPLQRIIDVTTTPLKDIIFLQLKTALKGTIVCVADKETKKECEESQVTLKMIDSVVETKTIKAQAGEYVFEDVLPGHYEVIVDTDIFCWDNSNYQIVIASEKPPNVPPFKQTGYAITFISSHDIKVEYSLPGQPNKKMSLELSKGSTRHCVPAPGKYEFHPKGCHKYQQPSLAWHTNERAPIILSSTEHLVSGSISSPVAVDGISIRIVAEAEGKAPIVLNSQKSAELKGNVYEYVFSFDAVAGENYIISPLSEALLFNPSSVKVTGPEDCQNVVNFLAEKGKIISGTISPPLEGVSIKIYGKDKEAPVQTLVTRQDGTFKVGPLDGSIEYTITAEKEGFVLKRDTSARDYKFLARKLAEINIQVVDAVGSVPLQGVLISLSGGGAGSSSYRKNSITGEDGKLTFNSLSPGDYYLRPTMKEYRFEPPSKMIRVEEGKSVTVSLVGRRVAFSAYGIVTCLNGEPEAGLLVEARGQNECSELQEEATTKEDGTWRIRGLEPKCIYAIRLKLDGREPNSRALRAIPNSVAVAITTQDVKNIKLMALQPVSRTDVSVRVVSNQLENYRTLKVKLCREDLPDSPVHIAKLDANQYSAKAPVNAGYLLHFPSLQADGTKYFVQLETSLSRSTHDYETQAVYFEANSSFKYAELRFDAERKHDHGDANQITFVPLPFIILVTIAFFKRDSLSSWLSTTLERWASRRSSPSASRSAQAAARENLAAAMDPRIDEIIAEQIKNINAKSTKKVKPRKA